MGNTRTEQISLLLDRSLVTGDSVAADLTCPAPWRTGERVRAEFRRLYASLLPRRDASSRVLAITGLRSGAGASWITSKLACAASEAGETVNILDANHTNPGQLQCFGFGEVDKDSAAECATGCATPWAKLRVFRCDKPAFEADVFDREVLGRLRTRSTLVLVDTEPLLGLPGRPGFVSALDGVIGVVESGRERPGDVAEAVAFLQSVQVPLAGFVVNKRKQVLPGFLERLL